MCRSPLKVLCRSLLIALLSGAGVARDLGREVGLPLLVDIPRSPIPVRADGVFRLVDGIPDNVPANRAPPGTTVETMGGTCVVLDLGKGLYSARKDEIPLDNWRISFR